MSRRIRHLYEFGPFRLDPEKSCLWRDGQPVPLTPKAVETLLVLVQQNGKLVQREDLMNAIWPDTFVEDGNLNFNVSVLRKALGTDEAGEQYIKTIPRRGYQFIADVREVTEDVPALIVEKHTRARVVIEERELPAQASLNGQSPQLLLAGASRRKIWIYAAGIASLLLVAAATWSLTNRPAKEAGREIRSIAVLPLKPLGNEEADRTLSLGLTDTLITRLGSLHSLIVRPVLPNSQYAESEHDSVEIGRKLQVDAVLEATLQRTDNRIRINARLLRVSDNALIWSASFNENETDIFRLQDQLALQLTESLVSRLTPKEKELLAKRYTQNTEAFHAYWRGRFFLEKRNPPKAILEFQQAINLDANYALPHAGLADAYTAQAATTTGADTALYENAKASINKALALDPTLSDSHNSLGQLEYYHDWDWGSAEQSFKRALELDPGNVNAHQFYARLLTTLGRYDEAMAEIQKARELDPRSADLAVPLFAMLEKRGEFDEALKVLETSLGMDEDSLIAQRAVGKIYLLKGNYEKVVELGSKHFPNPGTADFAWASMLATAYHRIGRDGEAKEMQTHLKQLATKDPKALYFLVMHYSELGQKDEALAALQKCYELREERMVWTKDEPRFAGIKDDPRFLAILRKMNLPT